MREQRKGEGGGGGEEEERRGGGGGRGVEEQQERVDILGRYSSCGPLAPWTGGGQQHFTSTLDMEALQVAAAGIIIHKV